MLTFSELRNKKVYTEDRVMVGRFRDLVFDVEKIPRVTKLFVSPHKYGRRDFFIPARFVQHIHDDITIAKNYEIDHLEPNELFVHKNLIDKQIIDLEGRKVVRVNDVVLSKKRNNLILAGVDTGIMGILRWLGLEDRAKGFLKRFGKSLPSSILPWTSIQPLELSEGKVVLNISQEKLEDVYPEDLADYLEATNMDNIVKTLKLLDPDFAADVVAELHLDYQVQLCKEIGSAKASEIIALMDPDEAVDLLTALSLRRRDAILDALEGGRRQELLQLMRFVDTGVGDFLTSEFLAVGQDEIVGRVLDRVKKEGRDISFLHYVYVINAKEQLVGVCTLHELLLHKANTHVRKIMHENPVVAHLHTPLSVIQRRLIKYKLTSLPVIDRTRRIRGIVTFDDIGEFFLDKAIEP